MWNAGTVVGYLPLRSRPYTCQMLCWLAVADGTVTRTHGSDRKQNEVFNYKVRNEVNVWV